MIQTEPAFKIFDKGIIKKVNFKRYFPDFYSFFKYFFQNRSGF